MQRNKKGYILLYFLSFCISTGVFHAVAYAQEAASAAERIQLIDPYTNVPTPTVFVQSPIAIKQSTKAAEVTPVVNKAVETSKVHEAQKNSAKEVLAATPTIPMPTATPPSADESTTISTPEPTNPPAPELEAMFDKYSSEYGVDKELMKKIARCESGFNTTSNNSGIYLGMFQFGSQTWVANRNRMGLDSNPDLRTNPEEAIKTAAYVISTRGPGAWPNCH